MHNLNWIKRKAEPDTFLLTKHGTENALNKDM